MAGADLSAVLCPPYDIISPAERRAAPRARSAQRGAHRAAGRPRRRRPRRLPGRGADGGRVAHATACCARTAQPTLTLHRDDLDDAGGRPGQCDRRPRAAAPRAVRPGSGVLPHERTLGGPKEDRYALLRATGLNTSPIVVLADAGRASDGSAGTAAAALDERLAAIADRAPDADRGPRRRPPSRLWVVPTTDHGRDDGGERTDRSAAPASDDLADGWSLLAILAAAPLTIADGHHRYETALRYREERGREPRLRERPRLGLRPGARLPARRGAAGAADAPGPAGRARRRRAARGARRPSRDVERAGRARTSCSSAMATPRSIADGDERAAAASAC